MEIKENGAWVVGESEPGHCYVEQMSDIIINIINQKKPELVYDFGCGYGEYVRDISLLGIEAVGFEAYPNKKVYDNIQELDLSVPVLLERSADISISLEVGEHIPVKFEQVFIDNICNNTKSTVILSWAIEGQDGDGHVNCKNNDYVISEMAKRGFLFDDAALELRNAFDSKHWFYNTLMLFSKNK